MSRGIHPAILTDRGLGPALESLAARLPLQLAFVALPKARLPEAVEVAAYFLVAEALTNVVKHSGATRARVAVTCSETRARIEVGDDGAGGAALSEGSGLRGLADRLEALGGTLEVTSEAGMGTTAVGEVPLPTAPALRPQRTDSGFEHAFVWTRRREPEFEDRVRRSSRDAGRLYA